MGEKQNEPFQLSFNASLKVDCCLTGGEGLDEGCLCAKSREKE